MDCDNLEEHWDILNKLFDDDDQVPQGGRTQLNMILEAQFKVIKELKKHVVSLTNVTRDLEYISDLKSRIEKLEKKKFRLVCESDGYESD